jgi:hypothetical protein
LLVTAKRLLGPLAIRHVLERAGQADDLTCVVPGGLAARTEPAILSGFGPEPIFHIVRLSLLDMGG